MKSKGANVKTDGIGKAVKECVYPLCESRRHTRGLCNKHYASARYYIRRSYGTEKDLLKRGLMLPRRPTRERTHEAFRSGSDVLGDASKDD